MNDIDLIRPILSDADMAALAELSEELQDTLRHAQIFRTRTEMEVSVLNDVKRPTPDAKYWQAVREQNVMFVELVNMSYDYREAVVKLRKAQRKLENWTDEDGDDLDRQLVQIEIDRLSWQITNMERVAHDRIREIREWSDIKAKLRPKMRCGTTDPGEHQLVSYAIGWLREIQAGGLNTGSQPERINLAAKADAALKLAGERGVLDKILSEFPQDFIREIAAIGGEQCQQPISEYRKKIPGKA